MSNKCEMCEKLVDNLEELILPVLENHRAFPDHNLCECDEVIHTDSSHRIHLAEMIATALRVAYHSSLQPPPASPVIGCGTCNDAGEVMEYDFRQHETMVPCPDCSPQCPCTGLTLLCLTRQT
jgi:hypothetical protein